MKRLGDEAGKYAGEKIFQTKSPTPKPNGDTGVQLFFFILLQCSSGVVRHLRDLQVSVASRSCRVLIFASS